MTALARILVFVLTMAMWLPGGTALAVLPDEMLEDSALENRARLISQELRCVVCQNQSIDDSDAQLARDLRHLVRERLVAGDSDSEVIAYVVSRYGDFVLLRPPVKPTTYLLWAAPAILLVLGAAGVWALFRQRKVVGEAPALDREEQERLNVLLGKAGRNGEPR